MDFLCLGAGLNIFINCTIGLAFGFAFQDIAANFYRVLSWPSQRRNIIETKDVGTVTKITCGIRLLRPSRRKTFLIKTFAAFLLFFRKGGLI
jgi:hypothetical protein